MPARIHNSSRSTIAGNATQLVAVTYDANTLSARRTAVAARESASGTTLSREMTFAHAGLVTRILAVPAARVASVEASFTGQPGVKRVGITGERRYPMTVSSPYFTNDPYFVGFSGASAPLYETASDDGQWDMHVIRLEDAFAYSQSTNGSGVFNSNALGSNSVKIAIIDTGEDTTHPELTSKITYQRCFITNSDGAQSTSNYTTDEDGHGTDVSGIAAADINNNLGFVGAGGNVIIYAYRVFPTPNDNCTDPNSTDVQCGSSPVDIAAAITDAVNQGVNVISLSLGTGQCSNGTDPDSTEDAAVKNAIKANVVVVAAAGNSSGPPVNAPGCDTGVIAVGATALADGQPNGSNKSGGSASAPFEYVASYTDYGTPGAQVNNANAWGIVAPGGDPLSSSNSGSSNDSDNLHWIENIWTSTPFDSNFAGTCSPDISSSSNVDDCRILIAGTSMSTPHVAGIAALIISVSPQYQSPTLMKQLLCNTADDISDPNEGCGRLDAYRAMATAILDSNPPGPSPVP